MRRCCCHTLGVMLLRVDRATQTQRMQLETNRHVDKVEMFSLFQKKTVLLQYGICPFSCPLPSLSAVIHCK